MPFAVSECAVRTAHSQQVSLRMCRSKGTYRTDLCSHNNTKMLFLDIHVKINPVWTKQSNIPKVARIDESHILLWTIFYFLEPRCGSLDSDARWRGMRWGRKGTKLRRRRNEFILKSWHFHLSSCPTVRPTEIDCREKEMPQGEWVKMRPHAEECCCVYQLFKFFRDRLKDGS